MVLLTKAPLLLLLLGGGAVGLKTPDTAVKLSQEDIDFLFGSQEAPPHSIINIHSRSREKRSSNTLTEKPGFLDVTLKDDEDEIEFELRPNYDLVSPDFKLVIRGEDGVIEERGMSGHACYYYGVAKGRPDTAAALSNCDGHGFTGVIVSSNCEFCSLRLASLCPVIVSFVPSDWRHCLQ
ncbi:uncharacterized protein LOC121856087 [Homarus americanus]|uniref:uncharacterized protein LOC121856087 n=1 Tax=Homarus americanus TaxID=6706 RepID=UPI001C46B488|nr:uncharacterized protein LOC121856087 [Homarus americanus]XP_042207317.1 uncharacterized protein LOC121856087 [Homarus americanus]